MRGVESFDVVWMRRNAKSRFPVDFRILVRNYSDRGDGSDDAVENEGRNRGRGEECGEEALCGKNLPSHACLLKILGPPQRSSARYGAFLLLDRSAFSFPSL